MRVYRGQGESLLSVLDATRCTRGDEEGVVAKHVRTCVYILDEAR